MRKRIVQIISFLSTFALALRSLMLRKRVVALGPLVSLLVLSILLAACRVVVEWYPCRSPSGQPTVCVRVRIQKAATTETIDASTLYETREVDPAIYAPDPNATASGVVTLTLASGSTVTHSQNLYYDSSTVLPPYTPGHQVLVYRPVNPAALQSFLNQYQSQTVDYSVDTDIPLRDISNGSASASTVDSRGHYNSTLEYHGTVNTEPPSRDREPIEM